jgi:hypothetical protein
MFILALQWICLFSEFLKIQKMSKPYGAGQPGTSSKILSLQKSPKSMRHQKLPKKSNCRVSFTRQAGSSQFDSFNLLRGNYWQNCEPIPGLLAVHPARRTLISSKSRKRRMRVSLHRRNLDAFAPYWLFERSGFL